MSASFRSTLFLALGAATLATFSGCEMRPAVVQVQPGAIHRSVFEGEWYVNQTVIDSPYSAGYTFVGEQGDLERIVWDIQESFLIARRSYDFIAGSEPDGISGPGTEQGAPIAVYAIESHFDIRRAYNPTTGEELNVVLENNTDRPWYQRDYLRVDWSRNLVSDYSFLVLARVFDGIQVEPVATHFEDPSHPYAPRFEVLSADGSWSGPIADASPINGDVSYIDIVNRMYVMPQTVEIPGLGPVPSCYLLYQGHLDCTPGEITVRNSFLRVTARDYEPMEYTGDRMERFGYFVTERAGYDPHYGVVESVRHRYVNRHNLWMESHRYEGEGESRRRVPCTTDTQCSSVPGSHCDLDLATAYRTYDAAGHLEGACTLPYMQREVRPIAYHVTANFPADLYPDAVHFTESWNTAFVETVGSLRALECQEIGGSDCDAQRTRPDAAEMFVLCHNPVVEADHDACGPVGTSARIGDLRYSIIGWVNDAHLSSPLGYGPSSADPLTGEIIMGNAFVYGAAMETLASFGRDIVALLNGALTEQSVLSGANVDQWVARMTAPTTRTGDSHAIPIDGEDVEDVAAAMDFSYLEDVISHRAPPASPAEFVERARQAHDALWHGGAFGDGVDRGATRVESLQGTDIERMMTTADVLMAAGIDPTVTRTDEVLEAASPLRGMSLANLRALRRMRDRIQSEHCILDAEFADDSMLGLARAIHEAATSGSGQMEWYGQTYELRGSDGAIDYELVRTMLRHPIFDAVTAHEVGHTIGLRHNFSGSFDALNYLPRYWQLRDDGSMAPRAWDPETPAEIAGRIREYEYSTVMDYGVNFVVTDAHGIGQYDRAAVEMGYGDLVEVFTNATNPGDVAWTAFIQSAGWPVNLRLSTFTGGEPSAHRYTDWPTIVGGIENLQERTAVRYSSLRPDAFLRTQGIREPLVDGANRPVVPYMFCSDEQADLNPDCLRYDQGADAYESVQTVIDSYWFYYIFTNFRRQRLGFGPSSVLTRVHDRYFEKLQRANQIYSLYRGVFEDIFGDSPGFDRFWTRPDGMGAWTLAAGASFNLLTRVATAPEVGDYGTVTLPDGTRALALDAGNEVSVEVMDGRFLETSWDFDAGYFWFDQLDRVGYFYDKVIALEVLVDPTTYFLGRDTDADIRRYQINFGNSFGPALTAFMRGVLAEDYRTIGPRARGGELVWPSPLEMQQGSMTGTPVDPNATFSIQLYASVYGMAYLPQTYDQTFLNQSRIFVRGGAESVELDPSIPLVEFTAPSGLTYVAPSYPDATGRETGAGAAMLRHALALQAGGASRELTQYIDNIDLVRRLTWRYGFGAQP